jgi:phage FluMu gp28-like protein
LQVTLPIQNFPKQQSIFDSKARFKIAAKGRRFGLTKGAANNFIEEALAGKFKKGIWVDVVNSNIDRYIERYFVPYLSLLPKETWNWQKQAHILHINDSYIDFRSADTPETMEGFGYDKFFINEAGIVLRDKYLWDNAIRPMFWDYPSSGVIGGTPKGKGVFYELAQRGKDPNQPEYEFFTFTPFDNPYIQKDIVEEDMKSMPERVIRQEIYAEFLDDSGVVFRGIGEIADSEPTKPNPDHIYSMGVDLARVQDYTVIAVYDKITNKQVYQARFNQLEWPYQKSRIAETAKHYNNATVVMDTTGLGDPIYNDLTRDGVGIVSYKFTNESKKLLIEKLSNWIELKRVHILNIEETKKEFTNFTYDISEATGRVHYEAPSGFHDDIVIAHALAVWDLTEKYVVKQGAPRSPIARDYAKRVEQYNKEDSEHEYF